MKLTLHYAVISVFLGFLPVSNSCTSFVVSGNNVVNATPILAKVRDTAYPVSDSLYYKEDLRFFRRKEALYAYVAVMFAQTSSNGSRDFISVGTNEKGLSVALNFATSEVALINKLYGSVAQQESDIIQNILENASTLAEAKNLIGALYQKNVLVPCLLTVSDTVSGLVVEIAVDTNKKIHYDFKATDQSGYNFVTNHFDRVSLQSYNEVVPEDSATRYARMSALFHKNAGEAYSLATALLLTKDYSNGELNSIFRNASRMTYIAEGDEQKSIIFVEFTNTAQLYNRAVITLDKNFWRNHNDGEMIIDADHPYDPGPVIGKFITY